jgi:hypothetical protein
MAPLLARSIGTGLLAGATGAAFAGVAAGVLHLSIPIAASVAGSLLALIVGYLAYRFPPAPPAPPA